jgi:hypothetical protein
MMRIADSWVVISIFHLIEPVLYFRMELHGALHRGLRVKLRGKGYLEEHVLHNIGAVRPRELEFIPLKEDIIETPGTGGQGGGITHLTLQGHQRQSHTA